MKSIPMIELKNLFTSVTDEVIKDIDSYEVFYSQDDFKSVIKITYIAQLPKGQSIILDTVGNPIKVSNSELTCIHKSKLDEYLRDDSCSTCVCNIDGLCPYGRDGKSIDKPCMHIDNVEGMLNLTNYIERIVEVLPEGHYKSIDSDVLTNLMLSLWLADNHGLIYNSSTGKLSNAFIYPISEGNKPVDDSIKVVSYSNLITYATGTREWPKDKKDMIEALVISRDSIIEDINDTVEVHNTIHDTSIELENING